MENVRTLFCGTSEFAIPILKKLIELDYIDLVGVVTQPDRPAGRKQILTAPPVKQFMSDEQLTIEIFQPGSLKEQAAEILRKTEPELIIVAAYGQFIPKVMLAYPKYKCLNIHGSILPELRGAVPVHMAILQGFNKTGTSIQIMSEKMDAGDIIGSKEISILKAETTETLMPKLAVLSAELLQEILAIWIGGEITPKPQDENEATYCYINDISKETAEIDWNKSADRIERMVRAFYPWPIAWFKLQVKDQMLNIKVFKANIVASLNVKSDVGQLIKIDEKLYVKCADEKYLELLEIQLEGRKRTEAKNYLYLVD